MWEIREDFVQEKTIVSRADEEIRVEQGGAGSARVHKDFVVERLVHLRNKDREHPAGAQGRSGRWFRMGLEHLHRCQSIRGPSRTSQEVFSLSFHSRKSFKV